MAKNLKEGIVLISDHLKMVSRIWVFDLTYNFVFYFLYFRWFDSYGIFKNLKLVLLTNLKIRSLGIKESALYFHMRMIKVRVYILNYF